MRLAHAADRFRRPIDAHNVTLPAPSRLGRTLTESVSPRPSGGVANQHEPAAGTTVRVHRGEVVLRTHPSEDARNVL